MDDLTKEPLAWGDKAPKHLMGWRPDLAPVAMKACQQFFSHYDGDESIIPEVPVPIWELTRLAGKGMPPPSLSQETGDSVAASISQVGLYLEGSEMSALGPGDRLRTWNVSYIYGCSRVQIGGGKIPGVGSTGSWGAAAVKLYGVLYDDDPGVPAYSGRLSDQWGEPPGPGENFLRMGSNNKIRTIAPLVAIDDIRHALCNYYPITVASSQGFRMRPSVRDGFHCFEPEGMWHHQMTLLAWMDYPFKAAYRMNTWGPGAHGRPLNGEPPGGAWCPVEILHNELDDPTNEFFAYSRFEGFPSAVDRGITA